MVDGKGSLQHAFFSRGEHEDSDHSRWLVRLCAGITDDLIRGDSGLGMPNINVGGRGSSN